LINVDSSINIDERTSMASVSDWLAAEQAAELLGVRRATLYAYVSRGLVRAQSLRGRREYARADLQVLRARSDARRGHAAVAKGALHFGEPVLDTEISAIDRRGPRYRGHGALELCERGVSIESVAELLWSGQLPTAEVVWEQPSSLERALVAKVRAESPLSRMLALLLGHEPAGEAPAQLPEESLDDARCLIQALALVAGNAHGSGSERRALRALRPGAARVGLARQFLSGFALPLRASTLSAVELGLILSADHELNASTFVARIAAGAGADLPRCLLAALSTLSGRRHGGSADRIEAALANAPRPEQALGWVRRELEARRELPGFGHPLYPGGDPRAPPLLARAIELGGGRRQMASVLVVRDAVELAGGAPPTIDFALVALAAALGLPRGAASALFALGRAIGHVAHVFEQRNQGHLLRPRARYVGA
jgi:citrate synthase